MAKNKTKKKGLVYLAFCNHCGEPKLISKYVAINYIKKERISSFYCDNCTKTTTIPNHLLKIIDELIDTI